MSTGKPHFVDCKDCNFIHVSFIVIFSWKYPKMNTSYAYCLFKHCDCRYHTFNVITASYATVFNAIECSLNESRSPLGCHWWSTVCVWLGAFNTPRKKQNTRRFAEKDFNMTSLENHIQIQYECIVSIKWHLAILLMFRLLSNQIVLTL